MTMSKVQQDSGRDSYEPIKKLSLVQVQPPRNPSKPFTSFNIDDILGSAQQHAEKLANEEDDFQQHKPHHNHNHNQNHNHNHNIHHYNDSDSLNGKDIDHPSPPPNRSHKPHKDVVVESRDNHVNSDNIKQHHHQQQQQQQQQQLKLESKYRENDHHRPHFQIESSPNRKYVVDSGLINGKYHNVHDLGLVNLAKSHHANGFRAALAISPPLISPLAGYHKILLPGLSSPFHFDPRTIVHPSQPPPPAPPQTRPTNFSSAHNAAKIIRPWDSHARDLSRSPISKTPPMAHNAHHILTTSEGSSDEDEEISVDDDEPVVSKNKNQSVSPLDALMAMTSKTFAGLDNSGGIDPKRRDQGSAFGKHQPPKKRRKSRTAFTNQQIYELEKRFLYQKYLTPADRDEIASSLGLTNAQVITWFQNRRAKLKRDLEELKNDVTAYKKPNFSKVTSSMSVVEQELRKVQEKTLRDCFNNGDMQSPSSCSLASLSDEPDVATPIHSPEKHEEDRTIGQQQLEPMETNYSVVDHRCESEAESNFSGSSNANPKEYQHDTNNGTTSDSERSRTDSRDNGSDMYARERKSPERIFEDSAIPCSSS